MRDYITVERVEKEIPFVKLTITTKNVDSKNIEDLKRAFSPNDFCLNNLTSNIQIHSDIVNIVKEDSIGSKIEGDALVTNLKNVPLLVFTADCVPVAIIDKDKKAIGVAHAGWRGTYEEIGRKTIEKMQSLYGSNPEDLVCVIGPSIGECCYQVSEDLYHDFKNRFKDSADTLYSKIDKGIDKKYYLNLWNINKHSLESIGVKSENIINLNICTNCNSDKFHSYRAHNKTAKRIGMILEIK